MLAETLTDVSAPLVKLCPACQTRLCPSRHADYCNVCAAARNRQYRAARKAAVLSGAVKWQCSTCGTTNLAFFLDSSPQCKTCKALHRHEREMAAADSEARDLDPQALAAVSIPAAGEETRARIDALATERLELWIEGGQRAMPEAERDRCQTIGNALAELWDRLRREVAAANFRPERRRPRVDGYESRGA